MLTEDEHEWLTRISERGYWPDGPFLRAPCAVSLMRRGLAEVIKPDRVPGRSQGFSYAVITRAGRDALSALPSPEAK